MLIYLLQSSTCLIILYGIYHFILAEMTFFKYNRAYLLISILASLMIPLLAPLLVLSEESIPVLHWSHVVGDITYIVANNEENAFDWMSLASTVLWAIYVLGVVVVILKMLYGLTKIYCYHKHGQKEDFNGYRIVTTEAVHLPFSFFKGIYVSRHVHLQDHIHTILEHEEIHIRQYHTLDVLMAEMVHAFFWFNPVMIFYKRALRQAHEYLADDLICRKNSVSSYTELLLSKSQSGLELALTNQFFHSQIKKRIQMMTTHKTNRRAAWKYALVLPLLMGLVVLFSSSAVKEQLHDAVSSSNDTIPIPSTPPIPPDSPLFHGNALMPEGITQISFDNNVAKVNLQTGLIKYYYLDNESDAKEFKKFYGQLPSTPPTPSFPPMHPCPPAANKEIFKVVEQMPRFPGCEGETQGFEKDDCAKNKMLEYIYSHLKYSSIANNMSIEGTVVAQFIINIDGSISDINIVRDIGGGCGQAVTEMLQTMNGMSEKWIPGRQAGRNVNVLYTLPVKFKMTDDQPKTSVSISTNIDEKAHQETLKSMLEMAAFPGSEHVKDPMQRMSASSNEMSKFIQKHLKYPSKAKENNIEGNVYVRLTLDAKGKVTDAMIKEDIGYGCGEEAVKVVKMMPNWIPATKDGKKVASTHTFPISFKLKSDEKNKSGKLLDIRSLIDSGSKLKINSGSDVRFKITGNETIQNIGFKKGELKVIKNNKVLREDIDYSIDYNTGKLNILNSKLLDEKGAFDVSFSNSKLNNTTINFEVKVFPNPTNDLIELSLQGTKEDVEVTIMDLSGKLLYQNKFENNQDHFKTKIDISQINVSTILVKTVQGYKLATNKVVVRK